MLQNWNESNHSSHTHTHTQWPHFHSDLFPVCSHSLSTDVPQLRQKTQRTQSCVQTEGLICTVLLCEHKVNEEAAAQDYWREDSVHT